MKRVDITPLAHGDMGGIKMYLMEKFGESSAKKIIGEIYDDLEKLADFVWNCNDVGRFGRLLKQN